MANDLVLTREQVRRVDQIAIERFGMSGLVLMENAGRGCVDVMEKIGIKRGATILCGSGNNAGDGFVIARHLAVRGYRAKCILSSSPDKLRGDAAVNFEILKRLNLPWIEWREIFPGPKVLEKFFHGNWMVDALLGTGAIGPPRSPMDVMIELANYNKSNNLAVDIPSGIDCDTGEAFETTFRADHTCTFVAPKPGLLLPAAREYVGQLHVLDLGVPFNKIEIES